MMSDYLITLTPFNKFFFGGEMTFQVGDDEDDDFNEQYASYIIESNYFPQQTSLLGMLRFLILRNSSFFENDKITNRIEVEKLIGKESFSVNDQQGEKQYGKIKSISGCFLQFRENTGNWTDLSFSPFDSQLRVENTRQVGVYNGRQIGTPTLEGFDAKDGYTKYVEAGEIKIPISEVFVEDIRLGINRNIVTGKTEKNALYKQVCYRLADKRYQHDEKGNRIKDEENKDMGDPCQFRFAFTAQIDEEQADCTLSDYNGQLVSIGGDNSQFRIGIENLGVSREQIVHVESDLKTVLQSPAYLAKAQVDKAFFAITEIVPFRFLRTSIAETESYDILTKHVTRSVLYQLYDRGSVFYFSDEESKTCFEKSLASRNAEFHQIGYNRCAKLVKKSKNKNL